MGIATIDFETYSEAGYRFDGKRWRSTTPAGKTGLSAIGAAAYSEHSSTDVICMAYDFHNGQGVKLWIPGQSVPFDLSHYVITGGLIEAHNSPFEFFVWNNVLTKKYGFPPLNILQLRCSMAKAMAWSLPAALGKIAQVLNSEEQKDAEGKRLIRKFSLPHTPTMKDPSLKINPLDSWEDGLKFYEYCVQDVKTEHSISSRIPELPETETEVFLTNQLVNTRGVQIDTETLEACVNVYDDCNFCYTNELRLLTANEVMKPGEVAKIIKWLGKHDINVRSLDADNIKKLLSDPELQPNVRRVIEIRDMLASASVKKLFSIKNRISKDGRLRDLFQYYGARTGRFSGKGPQPQNLPSSGPVEPWDIKNIESGILTLKTKRMDLIVDTYQNPVSLISGCLRSLFISAPGKDLMCSDYSAIEAVVLACLAGEQWRVEVFNTHGMIYEMSASKISGVPFQEFIDYKKTNGEHHPLRKKIGKVAELACFEGNTLVLTDRGWVKIKEISKFDKIHDGVEFVKHGGIINRGKRLTTTFKNVILTPDHKFYIGELVWKTTEDLKESYVYQGQGQYTACSLLSKYYLSLSLEELSEYFVDALAGLNRAYTYPTLETGSPHDVTFVRKLRAVKPGLNMVRGALKKFIEEDYLIDYLPLLEDAITRTISNLKHTEAAGLKYFLNGYRIKTGTYHTYEVWITGINQTLRLIELIMIKGMLQRTCDLSHIVNNKIIKDKPCGLLIWGKKCPSQNFMRDSLVISLMGILWLQPSEEVRLPRKLLKDQMTEVYDVTNCGKRSRFVILTSDGPLVAHNSGYQGFLGAWKAFGADKFMNDEEIKEACKKWRAESPNIVSFWYGLDRTAKLAIKMPGTEHTYKNISYYVNPIENVLYCVLPSGRKLAYHEPGLQPDVTPWGKNTEKITFKGYNSNPMQGAIGWVTLDTYGGKLTENVVQAVARDILTHAMVNLEKAGYATVMHIHDEVVCEIPEDFGSIEELEKIMSTTPTWCQNWPIKAAGGWRGKRYRKE